MRIGHSHAITLNEVGNSRYHLDLGISSPFLILRTCDVTPVFSSKFD
jgi:hypothetical protein